MSALALGSTVAGQLQTGPEILRAVEARYAERVSAIQNYTVEQEVMGTPATVYYEKRVADGRPRFVPVSMFTVLQERLDAQRQSFLEGAAKAGLQSLLSEVSGASYGQMGSLVRALTDVGQTMLESPPGSGHPPLETVRKVFVQGAARAGFEDVSRHIDGAAAGQVETLAASLAGLGDGSVLGQLGKIALGEAKNLVVKSLTAAAGAPLGSITGGLMPGSALGGVGGAAPGAVGPQALGVLAKAGMSALMGGVNAVVVSAMIPDLDQLDQAAGRMAGPDLYDLVELIGDNVRVAGPGSVDGHATWTLAVPDVSALRLPDADEFSPSAMTLHVDQALHVLRGGTIAGVVVADGQRTPVSLETRLEDYREVDGLLHPFRVVTIVRGVDQTLSEEERAQAAQMPAEIAAKMKQVEAQLAKLPPEQRAMAEQMLAQQMPQLAQMMTQAAATAAPELFDATVSVRSLVVNQGRPEALQVWGEGR